MCEIKYKVGDKVRIKSLDWYNRHAKETEVNCKYFPFSCYMKKYCGQIMTISIVRGCSYSMIEDDCKYAWTDEMIDCLVERNGKTYPYKIGDRVVLKGNNRCATITDLKYNSWGNLSYYIKIDNDKDISIDYPTELLSPYDTMVEGELTIEETKPKFKVGDKITNGEVTLTILTLSSDSYVVEDTFGECGTLYFKFMDNWKLAEVESEKKLSDESWRYKNIFDNSQYPQSFECPDGYIFKDENGNVINATKIVLEKKKEYPKTYEECCEVLSLGEDGRLYTKGYKASLIQNFQKLYICRDAYWKIAGDEMGLGKPWEPTKDEMIYSIYRHSNKIGTDMFLGKSVTFEFPTEEMRDAFYENFKEEMEKCKELL